VIELLDDPAEFARRAGGLLKSTVRNTVIATVLQGVLAGRHPDPPPRFAIVADDAGAVTGAALRTPPWPLTCTELAEPDAAALLARWLADEPDLPGVTAVASTARAIAAAWSRLTGGSVRLRTAMALHAVAPAGLRDPPRPAPGRLRAPRRAEHRLVIAWEWGSPRTPRWRRHRRPRSGSPGRGSRTDGRISGRSTAPPCRWPVIPR
jgi:hypothetical protein